MRVPIGVIGIIYESRPNVTADAAALCLKSGNAVVLRGGSEALRTNAAIADVFARRGRARGPAAAAVAARAHHRPRGGARLLLQQDDSIDVIIPRGGEELMRAITRGELAIPVIQHFEGICHLYVDGAADLAMAERICLNAKAAAARRLQRDREPAGAPRRSPPRSCRAIARALQARGVELRGCAETRAPRPGHRRPPPTPTGTPSTST